MSLFRRCFTRCCVWSRSRTVRALAGFILKISAIFRLLQSFCTDGLKPRLSDSKGPGLTCPVTQPATSSSSQNLQKLRIMRPTHGNARMAAMKRSNRECTLPNRKSVCHKPMRVAWTHSNRYTRNWSVARRLHFLKVEKRPVDAGRFYFSLLMRPAVLSVPTRDR